METFSAKQWPKIWHLVTLRVDIESQVQCCARNSLIPPRWFSFLCPFPFLNGWTPFPSVPAGFPVAKSRLLESGCLALCQSSKPNGPEIRWTNRKTTPTKKPLSLCLCRQIQHLCVHDINKAQTRISSWKSGKEKSNCTQTFKKKEKRKQNNGIETRSKDCEHAWN